MGTKIDGKKRQSHYDSAVNLLIFSSLLQVLVRHGNQSDYSPLPLSSSLHLQHTDNAIAISARLVHPCEYPSAVTPAIGPVKAEIKANTKPKAERQINMIPKIRIILLLPFLKKDLCFHRPY